MSTATERESPDWPFVYLTTTGWVSGRPHRIEIWYVELDGRWYLVSELRERAHWVQNLEYNPSSTLEVGETTHTTHGRVVEPSTEPELAAMVREAFDAKYGWSNGLIVEIRREARARGEGT